ncbi:MAG: ABC transporter ATP-binding protein [Thermacetogeniaceae bacterium]|jgi:putative spermidine/putrescine transport system ATP-binding protein
MDEKMNLEIRNIRKSFGETLVLNDITLTVPQGKITCLLGPSGCGKTTLLRTITGFLMLDSGKVFLGDEDITYLSPNRREIGMVYQNYALFTHMTVFDNVAFGLRVRKVEKKVIEEKVRDILKKVQLSGYEARYPSQLSGGQQQRVALARALVVQPKILLLDEPLSNLDAKLRVEVRRELRAIQRLFGVTAILVTHDQEEALDISDYIAVMNKGRIEHFGTPLEVYNNPKTKFTMEFIGEVNTFEGAVLGINSPEPDLCTIDCHSLGKIVCKKNDKYGVNSKVIVGIRPEQISLKPYQNLKNNCYNEFAGIVKDMSFIGPNIRYKVQLDPADYEINAIVQNRVNDLNRPMFGIGEKVIVTWDPKATMLVNQDERRDVE